MCVCVCVCVCLRAVRVPGSSPGAMEMPSGCRLQAGCEEQQTDGRFHHTHGRSVQAHGEGKAQALVNTAIRPTVMASSLLTLLCAVVLEACKEIHLREGKSPSQPGDGDTLYLQLKKENRKT